MYLEFWAAYDCLQLFTWKSVGVDINCLILVPFLEHLKFVTPLFWGVCGELRIVEKPGGNLVFFLLIVAAFLPGCPNDFYFLLK